MTTHNPRVIRGYASGITVALNQCRDGSMIELDVGTGQAVRETLLNYARSLEPDPRRSYYLVFWNEEHPALLEVVKRLDPYLAVDLTEDMGATEFVPKEAGVTVRGARTGIYVASKAKYGPEWVAMREAGAPIIATWINESEVGDTVDWSGLWERCITESRSAAALVLICRDGDILKGAWTEAGAALAAGVPVFACGIKTFSIRHHPNVRCFETEAQAFAAATEFAALEPTTPPPDDVSGGEAFRRGMLRAAEIADPPLMHRKGKPGLWRVRRAKIASDIRAEAAALPSAPPDDVRGSEIERLRGVLRKVGSRLDAARQRGTLNPGWHELEREVAAALSQASAGEDSV